MLQVFHLYLYVVALFFLMYVHCCLMRFKGDDKGECHTHLELRKDLQRFPGLGVLEVLTCVKTHSHKASPDDNPMAASKSLAKSGHCVWSPVRP